MSVKGLLVMDVDSTLIREEGIDLLGEKAGVGREVADITERAMRGELDFRQALFERVALLKGLPETILRMSCRKCTLHRELVSWLRPCMHVATR